MQQKPDTVRRTCVCGSTTWHETKTRDAAGNMPVHGTISCSKCGAPKFASQFTETMESEEE
jgi:hypothetical protein